MAHDEKAAVDMIDDWMGTGFETFGYENSCFDVVGSDSLEPLGLLVGAGYSWDGYLRWLDDVVGLKD